MAAFTPVLLSALLGLSLAQDLSYDGSAVWLHVSTATRGRDDRTGRVLSTAVVMGPVLALMVGIGLAVSGAWALAPLVLGLSIGIALIGLGVGCVVGALWQWPAPPPGANPFTKGASGGLPGLLSFSLASLGTLVLSAPLVALAVAAIWRPWLGWVALPVGLALGALVLQHGIRYGGRLLDRRWPEVMAAVSERAG